MPPLIAAVSGFDTSSAGFHRCLSYRQSEFLRELNGRLLPKETFERVSRTVKIGRNKYIRKRRTMGAATKRRVIVSESIGLMPEVAAHKVNSAAGGREGPLGEVVRAKA